MGEQCGRARLCQRELWAALAWVALLLAGPSCRCSEDHGALSSVTVGGDSGSAAQTAASTSGSAAVADPDGLRAGSVPELPAGDAALTAAQADRLLRLDELARLQLDGAGEQPRRALRYGETAIPRLRLLLDVDLDMSVAHAAAPGAAEKPPIPELHVELDARVHDPEPADSRFELRAVVVDVQAEPRAESERRMVEEMRPFLEALEGIEAAIVVTDRGLTSEVRTQASAKLPVEALQLWGTIANALRDAIVPFPAEAVGQGARWRVLSRRSEAGADMLRSSSWHLVAMKEQELRLEVAIREVGAQPARRSDALPEELALRVIRAAASGKRRVVWGGSHPIVRLSETQLESNLTVEAAPAAGMPGGGGAHRSTVQTKQSVMLSRPPSDAGP